MFYYDDSSFYKKKEFRSSYYLLDIWELISQDFIYFLGIIRSANVTIICDGTIVYIIVTSNFKTIVDKKYTLKKNHSLSLCEDFSIEIHLNIVTGIKRLNIHNYKSTLYYSPNTFDEGVVEVDLQIQCSFEHVEEVKKEILLKIVKEVQYAICRNIFYLDIEDRDSIIANIDSEYELVFLYSKLNSKSFEKSLSECVSQKLVCRDNKEFIDNIHTNILGEFNEQKKSKGSF